MNILNRRELFKKDNLLIMILLGVLVMIITWPSAAGNRTTSNSNARQDSPQTQAAEDDLQMLEKRLSRILSQMEGVGEVVVMITKEASEELVYGQEDGLGREAKVIKTIAPQIRGVVVVAKGADKGRTNQIISEACRALLGIDSKRIKVVKMK